MAHSLMADAPARDDQRLGVTQELAAQVSDRLASLWITWNTLIYGGVQPEGPSEAAPVDADRVVAINDRLGHVIRSLEDLNNQVLNRI